MARRAGGRTRLRLFSALLLIAMVGGIYLWWHLHHWLPTREAYPMQGIEIGAQDGTVNWASLKAIGGDFAYIDASASAFARDSHFVRNFEQARVAGFPVGAVHLYDPCQPADKQAANFVTVVPRDPELLPPAVELDMLADQCPVDVSDAAVESELMTFLNQVEMHTGKPALLKLSSGFEDRYGIAARIDRNLWLVRNRFQPDYGGRPWTMWTANSALMNEIAEQGLRWVVVQR
jgi:lysozyme